jgi:hypothetical protein
MTVGVDVTELVIQGVLRQSSELQALVGMRVYTRTPADPTYPLVRAERKGGFLRGVGVHRDHARVEYRVISDKAPPDGAGTQKGTWRIAETVREALIGLRNVDLPPFGHVTGVEETIAPADFDTKDGRYTYIGEVTMYVHPLPESS